jgi:hypothetical protein
VLHVPRRRGARDAGSELRNEGETDRGTHSHCGSHSGPSGGTNIELEANIKGYTVFSVPVGVLYRPSEAKMKNAQKKDYLGQAKLIAATDARDGFTGFTGAEIKKVAPPAKLLTIVK